MMSAQLRDSVNAILTYCADATFKARVQSEVDYLIACSESECSPDEMRTYISATLAPCNQPRDIQLTNVIMRAMMNCIAAA